MRDPFNLQRFIEAQNPVYEDVLSELQSGQKCSHWMWFIFPQIKGLAESPTSIKFALSGLDEVQAYIDHDVLGRRLIECTQLVCRTRRVTAQQIFGFPDYLKFRSCMTLFALTSSDTEPFVSALDRFFDANRDEKTLRILNMSSD